MRASRVAWKLGLGTVVTRGEPLGEGRLWRSRRKAGGAAKERVGCRLKPRRGASDQWEDARSATRFAPPEARCTAARRALRRYSCAATRFAPPEARCTAARRALQSYPCSYAIDNAAATRLPSATRMLNVRHAARVSIASTPTRASCSA